MSARTSIAWCDASWNPVVGCSRVSAGCEHCYAERFAHRWRNIEGHALGGLTRESGGWNGTVRLNEKALELPLRWRKPKRIFVNSMSDLFHESLRDADIGRVFEVMGSAEQHTFIVLTKRPERMRDFVLRYSAPGGPLGRPNPRVWLGVSCENQATANERIPLLLQTPAAKRFLSAEPLLGPINYRWAKWHDYKTQERERRAAGAAVLSDHLDGLRRLDWIIVGGESGPGARPCDVAWIRSTVEQCKAAGVAVFVKQLGARPYSLAGDSLCANGEPPVGSLLSLQSRAGSDSSEWPEDLRVQEWPA